MSDGEPVIHTLNGEGAEQTNSSASSMPPTEGTSEPDHTAKPKPASAAVRRRATAVKPAKGKLVRPAQPVARKSAPLLPRTLAVDIGGSHVKVEVLDRTGKPIAEKARVATPRPATPAAIVMAIERLASALGDFERVSVGFPGVVKEGVTYTAFNLSPRWAAFRLAETLRRRLGRPTRIANDADVQGMGSIRGRGVELVITLGTGFGSALFIEGTLVPNLQLGHHEARKGRTYEDELGDAAFQVDGKRKWNKRLQRAIEMLRATFNFDALYIGGGNTRFIELKLPGDVKVVSNEEGLLGGIVLWRDHEERAGKSK